MPPTLAFTLRSAAAAGLPPDGELLRRFAATRDEAAFELLVRRHAGAVLRVCGAVAGDVHAAEDAGQAAFLALARKADTLAGADCVAGWLCRVAYRAAMKARRDLHKPTGINPVARQATDPALAAERADLAAVVWAEVGRLPDRYHAPVVLCYLHGLSNAEAARRLGWPAGTVAGRLARARDVLRTRLARRGLGVPVLAATLGGPAVVPAAFVADAVRTSVGVAPPAVAALTREVVYAMNTTKRRLVAGCAAAVLGLAATVMTAATHAGDDKKLPPAEKKPADPPKDEKAAARNEFIVFGTVYESDGKTPMAGVEVNASAGMGSLFHTGTTKTDKDGKFRLTFGPGIAMRKGELYAVGIVSVRKPGWTGGAWAWPAQFILTETPLTQEQMKESPKYTNLTPGVPFKLRFHMAPAAAVKVRLLDAAEKPMANAKLWMTGEHLPPGGSVVAQGKTDANGVFTATEIPRSPYRLVLGDPKDFHKELVLGEIDFKGAAEYVVDVTVYEWTPTARHVKFKYTRGKDLKP